jgi:cyclic lactone autoinducer peptide
MKRKMIFLVCAVVAMLATLAAQSTVYACLPFVTYQPKAPKSLIKQ